MNDRISRATPLLVFAAIFATGSAWIIRPVPGGVAPLPPMPKAPPVFLPLVQSPPPAPEEAPKITEQDVQQLRAALENAEAAVRESREALNVSDAELQALQQKVDELRAELAALEAKRAAILAAIGRTPTPQDEPLSAAVQQKRQEVAELESNLSSLRDQISALKAKTHVRTALNPRWKLPMPVELYGNRIAPVDRDFFRYPLLPLTTTIVVTRKHPGETIAEARKPDSAFHDYLADMRKHGGYVSCLLNSDSFEAFFAVRDMAKRAGVDVSWEPAWTESGKITITEVHFVKKASKKDVTIALPQIVR